VVHISIIILALILASSSTVFIYSRNKKRTQLVNSLKAPNYSTAVNLRSMGYISYEKFLEATQQAQTVLKEGNRLFLSGELLQAIQQYEKALSTFELHHDANLITECLYLMAKVHLEVEILSESSSFLRRIPDSPHKGFYWMIQGLLAEYANNWGEAEKAWRNSLAVSDLNEVYRLRCQGALLAIEFQSLIRNPTDMEKASFLAHLIEWETQCEKQEIPWELCQAYLLHAKFNFAIYQLDEVDPWYQRCLTLALEAGIHHYYDLALKEQKNFQQHKKQIISLFETDRPLSQEEQESLFQEYMQKALESVQNANI
ncbi:MAG: hypothetical protein ACW98I_15020, partial [Candidatus Hodarchaeales archaeon]